ncbi:MAG: hypothetical protein GX962_11965 [Epulopiscium sp.]|nr:hypothetical protein [Candidatus Epulonipiscium sp.]
MFIIFTIFNFVSTSTLLYLGNLIECKLGIYSNIDVEKVRSFITTISSGILGSVIVAVVFYINEYNSKKRENIHSIIRESNKLQKLYMAFPYIPKKGQYYELERQYYFEYLENKRKEEFNNTLDRFQHAAPKDMKREIREQNEKIKETNSYEYEKKLGELLLEYPQLRKSRFDDNVIDVEQKLKDIIIQYDIYIDKMMENIECLINSNLEELELYIDEYVCVFNFSKKKKHNILNHFKPEIVEANRIYPYDSNEQISSVTIANRLYTIHTRFIKKIIAHLQKIEDISKCADRKEALILFLWLQDDIYGTDVKVIPIIDSNEEVISETKIDYVYNKLNMCIDNLQSILFGEISNKYNYYPQEYFVRKGESVEYGHMIKMVEMAGDVAYGDIYRK